MAITMLRGARPLRSAVAALPRHALAPTRSSPVWTRYHTATRVQSPVTALAKPTVAALVPLSRQYATKPVDHIDLKHEKEISGRKITPHPELVSSDSSIHPVLGEIGKAEEEHDTDMMAGIRSDMKTIKETFSLQDVPREAYYVGMAGVLPYLVTSLSTIFCAWEINTAAASGTGLLMSAQTAELALHVIEPLQVGYGAVIISFLGAIHWGLEWAGYGGHQGYPRYAIGIVAPAIAWPTILLPVEYALITQFLAFNFLYYADSRATKRGWAPHWYGVYRFVLTFIVGSAIVISLIGRGHVGDRIGKLPGPADRVKALRDAQLGQLEEEERERRRRAAAADEDDEDDE